MADSRPREVAADGRMPVWDAAVRVLHASLAALVLADFVLDDGGPLHRALGYGAASVVLVRLAWSVVASGECGWRALVPSMGRTLDYLHRGAPRTLGHDPLGLWMVWLLWALVLALGVTGWMARLDAFWGDETVHAIHAVLADVLMGAVVLHFGGVAVMSWLWRENLPTAMVSGRKRPPD
jgi:cytochrome b